jgi:hypothetical protein
MLAMAAKSVGAVPVNLSVLDTAFNSVAVGLMSACLESCKQYSL